jgi:hypothetical protein
MGHLRSSCRCPITCHHCLSPGHIASNCRAANLNLGFQPKKPHSDCFLGKDYSKRKDIDISGWFHGENCAGLSSPPVFQNFTEFWHAIVSPRRDSLTTPYTELVIYNATPAPCSAPATSLELIISSASMAFQLADPQPFLPRGFEHLEVHGRKHMSRSVVGREQFVHEEWVILSIEPFPLHEVIFANIREVSLEFLVQHKRVQIRDIQKTQLGQALVQFVHIYDRDRLISQSPHPYGDVNFSFSKHNEGRNWLQVEYNRGMVDDAEFSLGLSFSRG